MPPEDATAAAEESLRRIGKRVRDLRTAQKATLQTLAEQAGLSASMLSMIERGVASPSLTSLSALAHSLGVTLPDLITTAPMSSKDLVSRFDEAAPIYTSDGVLRRILLEDLRRDVKITWNEYAPDVGNNPLGIEHKGYEYGYCLSGELTVEVEGRPFLLKTGDTIQFPSRRRHKIWNYGKEKAVAIWFNLYGEEVPPES